MRKMFSKNQIAVIAKSAVDPNEILSFITKSGAGELTISANLITQSIIMNEETELRAQMLAVPDFSYIYNADDDSLQDKLDEKQDVVSLEAEVTFGADLTNHKLYLESKSNLTSEEITTIRDNMTYWIKKGYLCVEGSTRKIKLNSFKKNNAVIEIWANSIEYDSSIQVSVLIQFYIKCDSTDEQYTIDIVEM